MARRPVTANDKYRRWIRAKRVLVPTDVVRPFLQDAIRVHGSRKKLAHFTEIHLRVLHRIEYENATGTEYETAEKLALAAGAVFRFSVAVPPPGLDEWSRVGRFCGDGAGPKRDGCGTFHHEHYLDGLCSECWQREIAGVEGVPRDVRESKPRNYRADSGVRGRSCLRSSGAGDDSSGQLSLL